MDEQVFKTEGPLADLLYCHCLKTSWF